jgi:predicted helicase
MHGNATDQKQWCYEFEQNQMERAMTDQINLIADTDEARSFNRDCKEEMAQKNKIEKAEY